MKALTLVFVTALLLLTSCSKKENPMGIPDFTSENWMNSFQYVLSIDLNYGPTNENESQILITFMSKTKYDNPSLKIDNHQCTLINEIPEYLNGMYTYHFNPGTASIQHDSLYTYEIITSRGLTLEGAVSMPSMPSFNFPTFIPWHDYPFTWTLQNIPDVQYLYTFRLPDYESNSICTQLGNTIRSFTLPTSNKDDLTGIEIILDIRNVSHSKPLILAYGRVSVDKIFGYLTKH